MSGIEYLEWDTNFFGKKIGRLVCTDVDINPDHIDYDDYDLIYLFSHTKLPKKWDTNWVDLKIKSELKYRAHPQVMDPNIVEITSPVFSDALSHLVSINGQHSRFYVDQKLKSKYEELYQKWGEKCFNFETNRTWFYVHENKLIGFITIDISSRNQVELCSVDSNYRRLGIARKLWLHAFNEIAKDGEQTFHINFQGENKKARNLYESLGFKAYESWYIYHLWK